MLTPYIQDVGMWVDYYSKGIRSRSNHYTSDAETTAPPNNGSLSENASMSVSAVEPKGPLPEVPSTGPSASLRTVTSFEAAVQQATLNAMRAKIASGNVRTPRVGGSARARGRGRGGGGVKGRKNTGGRVKNPPYTSGMTFSNKASSRSGGKGRGKQKGSMLSGTPQDIFHDIQSKSSANKSKKKKSTK